MKDKEIFEAICFAVATAMERIQQGKYAPPTVEDLMKESARLGGRKKTEKKEPKTQINPKG